MKPIAEITDKRLARKMLEHVGLHGDLPTPWPARGPPESDASAWEDDDQRWPDDVSPKPDAV